MDGAERGSGVWFRGEDTLATARKTGCGPGPGTPTIARMTITFEWRGTFGNTEVNALHAEGFQHPPLDDDWWAQVNRHSLGWVCARQDGAATGREAAGLGALAGFVNVAWDGGVHAFLLDTLVTARHRRHGVATRLVAIATQEARAAGCEWLHVDFEDHLRGFYLDACGFAPTSAGLIAL